MKKLQGRPKKERNNDKNSVVSEAILEAFVQLAYEQGAAEVTLQKVADRARVAFGTVRYHFVKEDRSLLQSAILYIFEHSYKYIEQMSIEARRKEGFNPVLNYIETMFSWIGHFPAHASLLAYHWYLCTTQTQLSLPNRDFVEKAELRIVGYLHECIGMGLYPSVQDTRKLAREIHSALMGTGLVAMTQKDFPERAEVCKKMITDLIYAGSKDPHTQDR